MTRTRLTLFLWMFAGVCISQTKIFVGQSLRNSTHEELQAQFFSYEVFQLDAPAIDNFSRSQTSDLEFTLRLGRHDWDMTLQAQDLRSENYQLTTLTSTGERNLPKSRNITYQGQLRQQEKSKVSLTIFEDLIYGFVASGDEQYFIEPLRYFVPGGASDQFVVYSTRDVKPTDSSCGATEMEKRAPNETGGNSGLLRVAGNCYVIQLAIASDFLMFNKYGSVAGVEAHNLGVMNNVKANYDDEFADGINFEIVQVYVVSASGSDPWTTSTDAGDLLRSFTNWGPGGFSQPHDLGQLWTARDFDGNTIGIAWLSTLCSTHRYHTLQDFSSNANSLRVMTAHEIGHNLSADHDPSGSPTIMAPAVNNTSTWSASSIASINTHITSKAPPGGCLSNCSTGGGGSAPTANFSASPTTGCAPLQVTFTNQSSADATSWQWGFPGGNPVSSTAQHPVVQYGSSGTYSITLIATNASGSHTFTRSNYITVGSSPSANFSYSLSGNTVTFTNSSTNASSYNWNFGDGSFSSATNPVHTFISSGNYQVLLSAFNACGSSSKSATITITSPPVANFTASPTAGCSPLQITYTNQSTGGATSWSWSFPGGTPSTSTSQHPLVQYSSQGTYSASLTATNSSGSNTFTRSNYINVSSPPSADFSFNISGNTVTFTNSSTNASSYNWNFGDGSFSSATNPVRTYSSSGNYQVLLSAFNTCGSSSKSATITISSPPVANFTASPTAGCSPLQVTYTNQSTGGATSWSWSFPGGTPSTSTSQHPLVQYSSQGNYSVSLTATNSSGSNTFTRSNYINVSSPPLADFSFNISGNTVTFTNSSTNASSYNWNFGDGSFSSATNPVRTYSSSGNYQVLLSAYNACGSSSKSATITISSPPVANFTATPTAGCSPLQVTYTNQSTGGATSWSWSFPGGTPSTSTSQHPLVQYNSQGTYSASLTATNSSGSNTFTRSNYINVTAAPLAEFTYTLSGRRVTFINNTSNASSYSWNLGDGNFSSDINPVHTYAADGNFQVLLSAYNACGAGTKSITINVATLPTANFIAVPTSGCGPLQVTFNNQSSSNATSWFWSFPGGIPSTSTAQHPAVQYPSAGTYSVSLTASNSAGSITFSRNAYISVHGNPVPDFSFTASGRSVTFSNTSSNAASYNWNFGDGNFSSSTSPVHTFATDGNFQVNLTAINGCGSAGVSKSVAVISPPSANFSATPSSGCGPLQVTFQNQSSSNATSWLWSFPGGTPNSSTNQHPVILYANPGSFQVTLTAINAAGSNSLSKSDFIAIGGSPVANFNFSQNGRTITLTNASSNAVSYEWNFGDGNFSSATNPVHTFSSDGNFQVSLIATNGCGSSTSSKALTIVTPPIPGFMASPLSGCSPFHVYFTNQSSSNATHWLWSFPGGTPATSNAQHPVVQYSSAGTYSVILKAMNAAGENSTIKPNYIAVGANPNTDFNYTISGRTVTFFNFSLNAGSYSWNFGDGNFSSDTNPVHTFAGDGTYTVNLTAINNCGSTSKSLSVQIVTPPVANFSASSSMGCPGLEVAFSNQSTANATNWLWSFPGGNPASSTLKNPIVTYANAGSYAVTLVATNSAGSHTFMKTNFVQVSALPNPLFSLNVTGASVSMVNTSMNASSYSWDFGDGKSSSSTSPTHTYASEGTYQLTLNATNSCGTVSLNKTVTIILPPIAQFSIAGTKGCAPFKVKFKNESSANSTSFNWHFPGGNPSSSTLPNPEITYQSIGAYGATLTATNAAGSHTEAKTGIITVGTAPVAAFSGNVNGFQVNFTNNSLHATSYSWDFGDGPALSNEANPLYNYSKDGVYKVQLIANNFCGTDTAKAFITIITPPVAEFSALSTKGCSPFTVQYLNQSSDNATEYKWTFPGGTPSGSTEKNPLIAYNTEGVYEVHLKAGNSAGSSEKSKPAFITVGSIPLADFEFKTLDSTATFTNKTSNATSFLWNFGNGAVESSATNPTHIFSKDGNYTVQLTATNVCGSHSVSKQISIVTPPIAAFSADSTKGCAPFTVQYNNLSSENALSWQWNFPGGTPDSSSARNPGVIYHAAGLYEATLTAYNAAGSHVFTKKQYIQVIPKPVARFDFNVDLSTINFVNSSTDATQFAWNFGDGSSDNSIHPTHVFAEDGTFKVLLVATNECGSSSVEKTVQIMTPPLAAFKADKVSGCLPLKIQFSNLSSKNSKSFKWSFPGGTPSVSTDENPLVTYDSAGVFDVELHAENAMGSHISKMSAFVSTRTKPQAAFTMNVSKSTVTFLNKIEKGATYLWNFGDGNKSQGSNPIYEYRKDGIYTVMMTAVNDCGINTISQAVTIAFETPVAGATAGKRAGCRPLVVNFENLSSSNSKGWLWSFPGGNPASSTTKNPMVIYQTPGVYDLMLLAFNDFGTDTLLLKEYVIVNALPNVSFDFTANMGEVRFINNTTDALSFTWQFSNGTTSKETNPVMVFNTPGPHEVTLIASNGCGQATLKKIISLTLTDLDEQNRFEEFQVYPNPSSGKLTLSLRGLPQSLLELSLTSILGEVLMVENLAFHSGEILQHYDFDQLPPGLYLFRVKSGAHSYYRKIVIE